MVLYLRGDYSLCLSEEAEKRLVVYREQFMGEDTDRGLIEAYLEANNKSVVCIIELYQKALGNMGKPDRRESNEIADILRNGIGGWVDSGGKVKRFPEYGMQKYFECVNQADEISADFVPVPEQMELPFD